jgi:hypothetical protein
LFKTDLRIRTGTIHLDESHAQRIDEYVHHCLEPTYMHKIILGALTLSGLIIGASTIASAAPATPLLGHEATVQTAQVQKVDYYYNHRHYKHRSWDKSHKRWRYY